MFWAVFTGILGAVGVLVGIAFLICVFQELCK